MLARPAFDRAVLGFREAHFVRIRRYGFLTNRSRKAQLQRIRELLATSATTGAEQIDVVVTDEHLVCPECNKGRMIRVERVPRISLWAFTDRVPALLDTS